MAALNRPTEATYDIHEKVTVDTSGKRKRKEVREVIARSARVPNVLISIVILLLFQIMKITRSGKW